MSQIWGSLILIQHKWRTRSINRSYKVWLLISYPYVQRTYTQYADLTLLVSYFTLQFHTMSYGISCQSHATRRLWYLWHFICFSSAQPSNVRKDTVLLISHGFDICVRNHILRPCTKRQVRDIHSSKLDGMAFEVRLKSQKSFQIE